MNKELVKVMKDNFSSNEMLRIIDLTLRRVVDFGEHEYTTEEQKMFEKLREIKQIYGAGTFG